MVCLSGGIGRHEGLKIPWTEMFVRVLNSCLKIWEYLVNPLYLCCPQTTYRERITHVESL